MEVGGEKVRGHNGKDKKGGHNIKQLSVNFKRPDNCVGFVFCVEICLTTLNLWVLSCLLKEEWLLFTNSPFVFLNVLQYFMKDGYDRSC